MGDLTTALFSINPNDFFMTFPESSFQVVLISGEADLQLNYVR